MTTSPAALPAIEGEEDRSSRPIVPAWLISAAAHGVALGLMGLIVYAARPEFDEVAIQHSVVPAAPPVEPPPSTIEPLPIITDVIVTSDVEQIETPVTLETAEDIVEVAELNSDSDESQGRLDAVAAQELGAEGFSGVIGVGGPGSGKRGDGDGDGISSKGPRYVDKTGVPRKPAIDRALDWFKRHQSPNGQWDVDGYGANCAGEGLKCEPGRSHTGADGDLACTAYAVLCYLGMGYDHRMGSRYKKTVQRGLDWLVSQQGAEGLWGARNYEHAIVTMAVAEAYAMTNDPRLRDPAQRGVQVILARQAQDQGYGLGWDYVAPNAERIDASVSGWNAMALKAALAGGLDVGNGMAGVERYLQGAWKAANPTIDLKRIDPYTTESVFPYTWNARTGAVQVTPGGDSHDLSCVGAVCAVFLHRDGNDPMLNTLANHIEKTQKPTAWPLNTYYLYYNSLAIFQCGDQRFVPWSKQVDTLVCGAQRLDGCFSGSWDWEGTKFHGNDTGRLLSTAYCTLALEVIFRAKQVAR